MLLLFSLILQKDRLTFISFQKMESETILPKANTTFALTLLKKLCEDDRIGNIFCSPFSISSALAMVMLGTRGNTATQMSEVTYSQTLSTLFVEKHNMSQTSKSKSTTTAQLVYLDLT